MADINFSQSPEGYSLNTSYAGGGGAPMAGPDTSGMGNFFAEMARRKMRQAASERLRDKERQIVQDRMGRKQFDLSMRGQEQGLESQEAAAQRAQETFDRQKAAEDAPVLIDQIGGGQMGGFSGMAEAMPWSKGAAASGYTRSQINAMKPQNAGFEAGAGGPGQMQQELAAGRMQDDEDERRRRMARELSGERMTGEQAGWGLGYQPIGR